MGEEHAIRALCPKTQNNNQLANYKGHHQVTLWQIRTTNPVYHQILDAHLMYLLLSALATVVHFQTRVLYSPC
jgi:hypothetical protein